MNIYIYKYKKLFSLYCSNANFKTDSKSNLVVTLPLNLLSGDCAALSVQVDLMETSWLLQENKIKMMLIKK